MLTALASARAENRLALVVGNDAYEHVATLQKAKVDAKGYADVLRAKGFNVREGYDLTFVQLNAMIAGFVASIQPGDTAVFIYSGHGWSDGSQNYLVSVDAPASASEDELAGVTTPIRNGVAGVLDRIERKGAQLRVAIIDACRDNPFRPLARQRGFSFTRGLAPMQPPPQGTFVIFSASTGQSALDRLSEADSNPYSVFTRAFLPLLGSDLSLQQAIKKSQAEVVALARTVNHEQKPAYVDEVVGPACLSARCEAPPEVPSETTNEALLIIEAWDSADALYSLLPGLSEGSLKEKVRERANFLQLAPEGTMPPAKPSERLSADEPLASGPNPQLPDIGEAQPSADRAATNWAYLVVDADSGQVLIDNQGTAVWYPASLTDLMTVYVALDAVRNGRLTLDTPLIMSGRAARMPPSNMGFRPGTEVTLDNALKMLMVKSPNDIAVMVAEGVSGSVEAFADEMNAAAQRLGLHESHFVNSDGLHDPNHVSSARDMAMVALALLREFPDHADLFSIGALQLGHQYLPNDNDLLGRYPGADGMKTGFTCPAGFNVVASANHGGRRLIVVVLGAPTAKSRNQEAADLFDRGFAMSGGTGSLDTLPSGARVAPDPRANVCLHHSAAVLAAGEDVGSAAPNAGDAGAGAAGRGAPVNNPLAALLAPAHTLLSNERPHFDPVPVYVGPAPGWEGPALGPRPQRSRRPQSPTLTPQVAGRT